MVAVPVFAVPLTVADGHPVPQWKPQLARPSLAILMTNVIGTNVAVTAAAVEMVNVQVAAVPVHAPDHEPNSEFAFGAAVNVTVLPTA